MLCKLFPLDMVKKLLSSPALPAYKYVIEGLGLCYVHQVRCMGHQLHSVQTLLLAFGQTAPKQPSLGCIQMHIGKVKYNLVLERCIALGMKQFLSYMFLSVHSDAVMRKTSDIMQNVGGGCRA